MPNTREKLIELVDKARRYAADKCHSFAACAECSHYGEHDGNCKNAYIAESLIANGVTVQKWIPVAERLPEEDGKYLVYKGGHFGRGIYIVRFAKDARKVDKFEFRCRWKNVWYGYDSEWGHYDVDCVTHWMPLPEPPKED